jgi:hypothetical protein
MRNSKRTLTAASSVLTMVIASLLPSTALADCDLGCDWQKFIKLAQPLSPAKLEPDLSKGMSLLFFAFGHSRPIEEGDPNSVRQDPGAPAPDTSPSSAPGQQSNDTSSDSLDWLNKPWTPDIDRYAGMDKWEAPSGPCMGHLCGKFEELGVPDAGTEEDREGLRERQKIILDSEAQARERFNNMIYDSWFDAE